LAQREGKQLGRKRKFSSAEGVQSLTQSHVHLGTEVLRLCVRRYDGIDALHSRINIGGRGEDRASSLREVMITRG